MADRIAVSGWLEGRNLAGWQFFQARRLTKNPAFWAGFMTGFWSLSQAFRALTRALRRDTLREAVLA